MFRSQDSQTTLLEETPAYHAVRAAFRVVPIPQTIAAEARTTGKSPHYGHPAHAEVARGTGPCRACLRTFDIGNERRLLFTYNVFASLDEYPSPCPIFVHESPCEPFAEAGVFPPELKSLPLVFEAFAAGRWLLMQERNCESRAEETIARMFAHPAVEYIHVRHQQAGCFIALIQRG